MFRRLACAVPLLFYAVLSASAQSVLVKEVVSREVSLHVGGVQAWPVREAASRECSVYFRERGDSDYPQAVSRAVSVVNTTPAPPAAIVGLAVSASPTGETVTLDWANYLELAERDVERYDIYVSDQPFSDVSLMTPRGSVAAGTFSLVVEGLTAWQDHFFAVVPVDALGGFERAVIYAASYVFTSQIISREVSFFVGAGDLPAYPRPVSRAVTLAVGTDAVPERIANLAVSATPTGDIATLDWSSYLELAQRDIARYDIYVSAQPFADVSGMTADLSIPAGTQVAVVDGLTAWQDHFFAVVPVDVLGNFDPVVVYAASYVTTGEIVSREVSLFVGADDAAPYRGLASREVSILRPDAGIPAPVTGLGSGFTAATSTRAYQAIDLAWPDYNEVAQLDVVRYRVYVGLDYFADATGLEPYEIIGAGTLGHTVGGLDSGGIYYVAVVAEDVLGNYDPAVRSVSAQASVGGVTAVRNLAVVSGERSLDFSWDTPAEGVGFLDHYEVFFGGAAGPEILSAAATAWSATDLLAAHGYAFQIVAVDIFDIDNGTSSLLAATWLANPVPTAEELDGAIRLSWAGAEPGSLVRNYAIYQGDADFADISERAPVATTSQNSILVEGLTNWQTYHFAVVTVNISEGFSPAVTAVAAEPKPDLIGPRVIAAAPSGPAAAGAAVEQVFQEFTVTFNEEIMEGGFATVDVEVIDPDTHAVPVLGVEALSPTRFRVILADSVAAGTHTVIIGPDIPDLVGNQMDQDGDGSNGEDPQDRYEFTVELSNPGLPAGTGDGLLGEYFADPDLLLTSHRQIDAAVDFNWLNGAPRPELPGDYFSVAWSGQLEVRFDSDYTFAVNANDGARLWLDDELILDGWGDLATGTPVPLTQGRHEVRLEYVERTGDAAVTWSWACPFFGEQVVPRAQLHSGMDFAEFAATPGATPAGGTVATDTDIVLATATEGADIYFTLDDSEPLAGWQFFDGMPIHLAVDAVIRAVAVKADLNRSGIAVVGFEVEKTELSGTVWFDHNADGIRDGGDNPLSNVLVFIDADGNGRWTAGEKSTRSGIAGDYLLGDLYGGEYEVRVDPGEGRAASFPPAPARSHTVTPVTGEQIGGLDFGLADSQPPNAGFTPIVATSLPAEFAGTIDDPAASIRIGFNGAVLPAVNQGNGTWTVATAGFGAVPDGIYAMRLLPEDILGNAGEIVVPGAVHLDSTPPVVTGVSPLVVNGAVLARFEIQFDSPLSPGTVSVADFALTTPVGREILAPELMRLEDSAARVVVQFPPRLENGQYTLAVGPDISDIFGNPMAAVHEQVAILNLPDLVIPSLTVDPAEIRAGREVVVTWSEENVGALTAPGNWRTDFRLTTAVRGGESAIFLGSADSAGPLAAGAPRQRASRFILPNWIMTGDSLVIQADINANGGVLETDVANNRTSSAALSAPRALLVVLPVSETPENAGILRSQVWRNGDLAEPLDVSLAADPADRVSLPAQVRIAAGAAFAAFDLEISDDAIAGGDTPVRVAAVAADALGDEAELLITENDLVSLQVSTTSGNLFEGEELEGTVTRDLAGGTGEELVVSLDAFPGRQLLVPRDVVIPAGATEATFPITAIDDDVYEQTEDALVSARADGCNPARMTLTVDDDDAPVLTITVDPGSCSEGGGFQAATAVVSRHERAGADLTVKLTASDPASLSLPGTVVIPAGKEEIAFPVGAIDNDQVDGGRDVELTASALMNNCGCAAPGNQTTASVWLAVRDDDGPTLSLTVDKAVAGEGVGGAFAFRLRRNTDPVDELVVSLSAAPGGELDVPAEATLGIGEIEVAFTADTLDDGVQDGSKNVSVQATAGGYGLGEAQVVVTDAHLPDLVVTGVRAAAEVLAGNTFNLSYTMANLGLGDAVAEGVAGGWSQRVYLSPDPYIGDDQLVGDYTFDGTQPPGADFAITRTVSAFAPPVNGQYWVVVATDIGNDVAEILETNNTRISELPVTVRPSYTATVRTDLEVGLAGLTLAEVTPIVLYGTAQRETRAPAAYVPVHVHINLRDYQRVILAVTNAAGEFSAVFTPLPGEGGEYTIGACHPGEAEAPVQDSFALLGMRSDPQATAMVMAEGTVGNDAVVIHNLSEIPLTGLTAQVVRAPDYATVTTELGGTALPGLGSLQLAYRIEAATPPDGSEESEVVIRVSSTEGAVVEFSVDLTVQALSPALSASPEAMYAGMPRGERTLVEIRVENRGAAGSGPVAIDVPQAAWLSLVTPNPMPEIPAGGTGSVVISLTPAATADFVLYKGQMVLAPAAGGGDLAVPFDFRVVSAAVGDLAVTTVNQFYYYAEGAPTLPGAKVQVLDGLTGAPLAETASDEDGVALFGSLQEGFYTVVARADKHRESRETVFVAAGAVTPHVAYMVRKTVEVTWTVEKIELEDRVEVKIETTFETNVPAPVVTIEPAVIDLGRLTTVGQVERINLTISNHGLISAANMDLTVDTHPFYAIEPLITEIGDLPARSSLVIPVVLRRIGDFSTLRSRASVPCGMGARVTYDLCRSREGAAVSATNVEGSDCSASGGGGGGVGSAGGGDFSINVSPAGSGRDLCACILRGENCPCILPFLKAGFDCVLGFVPGYDAFKCVYGGGNCLYSLGTGGLSWTTGVGCLGAGFDCAAAVGKEAPGIGQILAAAGCVAGFASAIDECRSQRAAAGFPLPSANQQFETVMTLMHGIAAYRGIMLIYYGDPIWFDWVAEERRDWDDRFGEARAEFSAEGGLISAAEAALLIAEPAGPYIKTEHKQALIDRWNRTAEYWDAGWFGASDVPEGESLNFIDQVNLYGASMRIAIAEELAATLGYANAWDALEGEWIRLNAMIDQPAYASASRADIPAEGQCAKVKLELSQSVVLAREGFQATLKVENGDDLTLTDIGAGIVVTDENGFAAGHLVAVGQPDITYFTGVDGSGVLTAGDTGTAKWLIVPYAEAAPVKATVYYVGGTLTYAIDGTVLTVPLAPIPITVHPQPELHLEYYHQRDVRSDDPWTEDIEPSQPYELAVLVRNTGAGVARNLRIISAQPKIVENEKGLLIDFNIIGHEVDGQPLSPSLTAAFGDVAPYSSSVARWWLTSTLQGQFTEYKASFEHFSPFGDPRLSQIRNIDIYELIRAVTVDGQTAFLTNDQVDEEDYPDTIHTRAGDLLPVAVADGTAAIIAGTPSPAVPEVELEIPAVSGWNYLRLVDADPGGGDYVLVAVRDSLGSYLPATNFWQTDRTFVFGGVRPVPENNVHLLFRQDGPGGNARFTLVYQAADQVGPALTGIALPPATPAVQTQDAFVLTFSEPVDSASVTAADFLLEHDGIPVGALPPLVVAAVSGHVIRVAGFASANPAQGAYTLTAYGAGITDLFGNSGVGQATLEWLVPSAGPVPESLVPNGKAVQNTPIDAVQAVFSSDIQLGTVSEADLILRYNGSPVPLGGLAFAALGTDGATIGGLLPLCSGEGDYELILEASAILSLDGAPGFGSIHAEWTLDATAPTVADIRVAAKALVSHDIRALVSVLAVNAVRIDFSEPLAASGFSLTDLTLLLDSVPTALPSEARLRELFPGSYAVEGLAPACAADGVYMLRIDLAGVEDPAGNAGMGTADFEWRQDSLPPASPVVEGIDPDTGESADDFVTSASNVLVTGQVAEEGLAVFIREDEFGLRFPAAVAGTDFSVALANLAYGTHHLIAECRDGVGNSAETAFSIFVDTIGLAASLTPPATSADPLRIVFSADIDPATLEIADFAMTCNQVPLDLSGVLVAQLDSVTFEVANLPPVGNAGVCRFSVDLSGVEKRLSGKNGSQIAQTTWNPTAIIEHVSVTPKSTLVDDPVLVNSRAPVVAGETAAGWLQVEVVDAITRGRLAIAEVTDGRLDLPLSLARDGAFNLLLLSRDGFGLSGETGVDFMVDTVPPTIVGKDVYHDENGAVSLALKFSEPTNLPLRMADGTLLDGLSLNPVVRGTALAAADFSWNDDAATLNWHPGEPSGSNQIILELDAATVTDLAENPLSSADRVDLRFGPLAATLPEQSPAAGEEIAVAAQLLPDAASYLWKFGDATSSLLSAPDATHSYDAAGLYDLELTVNMDDGLRLHRSWRVAVGEALRFTLEPGWNAVALPNLPAGAQALTIAEIFADSARASLVEDAGWAWNPASFAMHAVNLPQVGQGIWLFRNADTPGQMASRPGRFAVPGTLRAPGLWNFTGVDGDVSFRQFLADHPEYAPTVIRWDALNQRFDILPEDAQLLRGEAYWLRRLTP